MFTSLRRSWIAAALGIAAIVLFASSRNLADRWVAAKYKPQTTFDSESWLNASSSGDESSMRQLMIRDLITNVLPGKKRDEIEALLGPSPTPDTMRRYTADDLRVRERDDAGNWKPFPRTGKGHYFDEHDWDLIYPIGREQILIYDHRGRELSPDEEHLIVRLDEAGEFASWYIDGSARWQRVVGRKALRGYRSARAKPRHLEGMESN